MNNARIKIGKYILHNEKLEGVDELDVWIEDDVSAAHFSEKDLEDVLDEFLPQGQFEQLPIFDFTTNLVKIGKYTIRELNYAIPLMIFICKGKGGMHMTSNDLIGVIEKFYTENI